MDRAIHVTRTRNAQAADLRSEQATREMRNEKRPTMRSGFRPKILADGVAFTISPLAPERYVPEKKLKTADVVCPSCVCLCLHPLPRFASVLHLLPLYASERGSRGPRAPTLRSKDFRDMALPRYASRRCQFIVQGTLCVCVLLLCSC